MKLKTLLTEATRDKRIVVGVTFDKNGSSYNIYKIDNGLVFTKDESGKKRMFTKDELKDIDFPPLPRQPRKSTKGQNVTTSRRAYEKILRDSVRSMEDDGMSTEHSFLHDVAQNLWMDKEVQSYIFRAYFPNRDKIRNSEGIEKILNDMEQFVR